MAVDIVVPRLGWSMEEGTFSGWLASAGTPVRRGQSIFTLEGEKATQDVESVGDGILHHAPDAPAPGDVVAVGRLIGIICSPDEKPVWQTARESPTSVQPTTPANTNSLPVVAPPSVRRLARKMGIDLKSIKPSWPDGRIGHHDLGVVLPGKHPEPIISDPGSQTVTPRARRLASQHRIDWSGLQGSGRNGRIRERDIAAQLLTSHANSTGQKMATSSMRRTIARHMINSRQQTVPVTLTTKADAAALLAARAAWKQQSGSLAPTINDALLLVMGKALLLHPGLAAQWHESHLLLPYPDGFHLGLAVDAPHGLVVPVIRNVPNQTLAALADQTRELIGKARENKLQPSEMSGAVFTVTSLGNLGVEYFNPVIHFPQCAIMGLGAIRQEVMPDDNGRPVFRPMLPLSLTFDHRITDGAPAARFLQEIVRGIEQYEPS